MGFQPNTYLFTKALAEKLMDDASRDLPVIVTRPSIGRHSASAQQQPVNEATEPNWTIRPNLPWNFKFVSISQSGLL